MERPYIITRKICQRRYRLTTVSAYRGGEAFLMAAGVKHQPTRPASLPEQMDEQFLDRLLDPRLETETMEPTTDLFTNNLSEIVRVWASYPMESVFPEVDPESDRFLRPGEGDADARLVSAFDAMVDAIHARYPNASDLWVECTGWEGAYAQFTPRAETEDGRSDEEFFDWLNEIEDALAS